MTENKKKVLGRGLGALLSDDKTADTKRPAVNPISNQAGVILYLPLNQIEVNPFQHAPLLKKEV